jgi:hypothetical protein
MAEPATATIVLDLAKGSVTLLNAFFQVAADQRGRRKPKAIAPTLSAFLGALPGAAHNAADVIKGEIKNLRQDCIVAGLNSGSSIGRQSSLGRSGRRMRAQFPVRIADITLRMSTFFDDVAALAQLVYRQPVDGVARTSAKNDALRTGVQSHRTVGEVLDSLDKLVEETREELLKLQASR